MKDGLEQDHYYHQFVDHCHSETNYVSRISSTESLEKWREETLGKLERIFQGSGSVSRARWNIALEMGMLSMVKEKAASPYWLIRAIDGLFS